MNLIEKLNQSPKKVIEHHLFKINEVPYLYVPIEQQEQTLTEIFGIYQKKITKLSFQLNHVIIELDLIVNYDNSSTYTQTGIGVEIIENQENLSLYISNATSKALSDAARNFGAVFGRGLNRQEIFYLQNTENDIENKESLAIQKRYETLKKIIKDSPKLFAVNLLKQSEFSLDIPLNTLVNNKK